MKARPLLYIFIVVASLSVHAEEPASDKAQTDRPQLSSRMQSLLNEISTPEQAGKEAREYMQNGQYGLAALVLKRGITLAKTANQDYSDLSSELEYELPLLEAKELMVFGNPDKAEAVLVKLAEKYREDDKRFAEIQALQDALPNSRKLAAVKKNNERQVTRDVRERMSKFYKKHGIFPVNYNDLNSIITAGDSILQNYEIIFFRSGGNAYLIVLRNQYNNQNLIRIEATGLVK